MLKIISTCPQKILRKIPPLACFLFNTDGTDFRNYHPAHLDSTEHRVAMGGWYGNLHAFTSILHYSSGHRPSDAILSSTSKMSSSQPSAALRAPKNTCVTKTIRMPHTPFSTCQIPFSPRHTSPPNSPSVTAGLAIRLRRTRQPSLQNSP